jgi:transcriptional regulator with XRE-family HTH domain
MIGELIKEKRELAGMTQLELAQKLGYESPQFVSLIERGLSKAPYELIGKCVVILGLPEKQIVSQLKQAFLDELTSEINQGKESCLKK